MKEKYPIRRYWPPEIVVAAGDWDADVNTVRLVLSAAGEALWRYFSPAETDPVLVYPGGGPLTLYRRGPANEYIVKLDTGGAYWAQYVFQFAHELCHVLIGIDRTNDDHRWFEESICELASLFVLRRLSEEWSSQPPYAHWQPYARHLSDYASARMESHLTGSEVSLADWYAAKADPQGRLIFRREWCTFVATSLLKDFEQTPDNWDTVRYLYAGSREVLTFEAFLNCWHARVTKDQQEFIHTIGKRFAIEIDGVVRRS